VLSEKVVKLGSSNLQLSRLLELTPITGTVQHFRNGNQQAPPNTKFRKQTNYHQKIIDTKPTYQLKLPPYLIPPISTTKRKHQTPKSHETIIFTAHTHKKKCTPTSYQDLVTITCRCRPSAHNTQMNARTPTLLTHPPTHQTHPESYPRYGTPQYRFLDPESHEKQKRERANSARLILVALDRRSDRDARVVMHHHSNGKHQTREAKNRGMK